MFKYFGIDRFFGIKNIVQLNGGWKNSFKKLIRFDCLKKGQLVGEDKYGNRYYENNYYFYGTNRWVEFTDHVGLDYDASHIPADWYGWMHYKTDLIPSCDESRPKHKWMADHSENYSGTEDRYYPYTTTRLKITAWDPKKN